MEEKIISFLKDCGFNSINTVEIVETDELEPEQIYVFVFKSNYKTKTAERFVFIAQGKMFNFFSVALATSSLLTNPMEFKPIREFQKATGSILKVYKIINK